MGKEGTNPNREKIKSNFDLLKEQIDALIRKLDVSDIDNSEITKDLKEKIEKSSPQELDKIEKNLGIDKNVEEYIKNLDEDSIETPYTVESVSEESEEKEEQIEEEKIDSSFKIKISEDKMNVTIDLIPSKGGGKPLNYENIKKTIEKMGIVYGVNYDLLQKLVESVENQKEVKMGVIIAQGTPPEEGKDGEIEFHFSESEDVLLENVNDNNKKGNVEK